MNWHKRPFSKYFLTQDLLIYILKGIVVNFIILKLEFSTQQCTESFAKSNLIPCLSILGSIFLFPMKSLWNMSELGPYKDIPLG